MTEKTIPSIAQDGYNKASLTEGYIRKGGSNNAVSQIQTRPPAPAPMNVAPAPAPVNVVPAAPAPTPAPQVATPSTGASTK